MARQLTWQERSTAREAAQKKIDAGEFRISESQMLQDVRTESEQQDWEFSLTIKARTERVYYGGPEVSLRFSGNKVIASEQLVHIPNSSLRNLINLAVEKFLQERAKDRLLDEATKVEIETLFPDVEVETV